MESEINRQVRVLSLGCEFCLSPARIKAITGVFASTGLMDKKQAPYVRF
nr:MAG TPA: hypothetical protein [Caudoviricetes sp.]